MFKLRQLIVVLIKIFHLCCSKVEWCSSIIVTHIHVMPQKLKVGQLIGHYPKVCEIELSKKQSLAFDWQIVQRVWAMELSNVFSLSQKVKVKVFLGNCPKCQMCFHLVRK